MRSFEDTNAILIEDEDHTLPTLSYAYGAADVAARFCGFEEPPYPPRGVWQHGWVRKDLMVDPAMVIWDDGTTEKDEYHWVSRMEIQEYLRKHGFPLATAIGVPHIDSS